MSVFKVFVDGQLFYHPNISRLAITQAEVSEDAESIDSLKLSAPIDHPYIDSIKPLHSIITLKKDDRIVFIGRAIDDGTDFYNTHTWNCESCLSFLKDSYQPPYDYQGPLKTMLETFITEHNKKVEDSKKFKLGNVTVTDNNDYIHYACQSYSNTMDAIKQKLIETHGGYLQVRYEGTDIYLDYLADFDESSMQTVEYGKNLLDVTITRDHSSRVTALIPFGAVIQDSTTPTTVGTAQKHIDITSVNNGVNYVFDQAAVNEIGWIWSTQTWSDVTLPSNLMTKAQKRLAELKDGVVSMELSIVDESDAGVDINDIHAREYVNCISAPHGINGRYLVLSKTTDYLNPSNNKISIGASNVKLTRITATETNKGPKGDAGPAGKNGKDGKDGKDGAVGPTGPQGVPGKDGAKGEPGPAGKDGTNGKDGATGPAGKDGKNGEDALSIVITSSDGLFFKNTAISTTLTATVYKGSSEITGDALTVLGNLNWFLNNSTTAKGTGATLEIGVGDVDEKATVVCELLSGPTVKAKAEVNLAVIKDIKTYTRYYQAVAAGDKAPDQPTTDPPASAWTDTEPAYDGTDKDLYYTDLTEYTDGSFSFSAVSQSSTAAAISDLSKTVAGNSADVNALQDTIRETSDAIDTKADEIKSYVDSTYVTADDLETAKTDLQTSITETESSIRLDFQQTTDTIDNKVDTNQSNLEEYIRFNDGTIELGKVGNAFTATLSNEELAFLQNGAAVAYVSDNSMKITDAEIDRKLSLGESAKGWFDFIPRSNGNLSVKWRNS